MVAQTSEQVIHQILAGTVRNFVNGFLIERKSRGLSKQTIKYYSNELRYFCAYLDEVGVINLDEVSSDLIRQYLLNMRAHRNQGGVHASYRAIKA